MKKFNVLFILVLFSLPILGQRFAINTNYDITFTNLQEALKTPKKVYHLDLSNQSLKEVPQSIEKFSNLSSLDLADNELRNLDIDFSVFPKLKYLELTNNELSSLPIQSLSHCADLRFIAIRNNKFEKIPKEYSQLKYLEVLDIGSNQIPEIDETIVLKYLKTFKADDNLLTSIPVFLEKSPKLKSLNLNRNYIKALPASLYSFKSLEKLDIGGNDLKGVIGLQNLTRLTTLILDWTELTAFEITAIMKLKKLKILSIENCGLQSIPKEIKNLRYLEELSLLNNTLTNLPDEIKNLKRLKKLWIGNNDFTNQTYLSFKDILPKCEIVF